MPKREMLILDRDLVNKIDEHRGDLSREDFIDFCIDKCLETLQPEEKAEERGGAGRRARATPEAEEVFATREEFQEFKRGITSLLRTFLEFFITFGLELGTGKSSVELERLKSQLGDILKEQ